MPRIKIREGEHFEQALRRFKKSCERFGILSEVKKREFYEKPSVSRKKKSINARRRLLKKSRRFGAEMQRQTTSRGVSALQK